MMVMNVELGFVERAQPSLRLCISQNRDGFVDMLNDYDVVRLKREMPNKGLSSGAVGTILLIYVQSPLPPAYEVEFTDGNGNALAILAVQEDEIEIVGT
jgi:hypothetical protein